MKLQCICAVLITIIFISPFSCDMIFSGIVVQYSCNDYLDFPYCCMCFHTFLLSSHIVIVKRAFALSGREVNSPIPRPFHSSVKFRKSEATKKSGSLFF